MREVVYQRHEFTSAEAEACTAPLRTFIYDVPYLGACGIFPPLHILNEIFARGGGDGGMGPGASWEPFEIGAAEYDELVREIAGLNPGSLGEAARYGELAFAFDPAFDHIQTWEEWIVAVCTKHRAAYHEKLDQLESS